MARMIDPAIAIGHTHVVTLPVDRFDIEPGYNIRIDREELTAHIRGIADSMKARGYDQGEPVLVRWENDRAIIREGHCRLMAVKLANEEGAGILGIPAISEPKGTNPVASLLRPITANSGLPPLGIEMAVAVRKALDQGWTEEQVAKHCGKSKGWVDGLLILNGAAVPIQQAVKSGELSSTEAVKLARTGTAASVATLEKARAARPAGTKRITAATVERVTAPRQRALRLNPAQKAIVKFQIAWLGWPERRREGAGIPSTVLAAIEGFDAVMPHGEGD